MAKDKSVGRTAKYQDPGVRAAIIDGLRRGNHFSTACVAAGISYSTFYSWRVKAQSGEAEPALVEFLKEVEIAIAMAEQVMLKVITEAATKDWKAAAWFLRQRHPDKWAGETALDAPPEQENETVVTYVPENGRTIDE